MFGFCVCSCCCYGAGADAVVGGFLLSCCCRFWVLVLATLFVVCLVLFGFVWFSVSVGACLLLVCITLFVWYLIVVAGLVNSVVHRCSWCGFAAAFLSFYGELLWFYVLAVGCCCCIAACGCFVLGGSLVAVR